MRSRPAWKKPLVVITGSEGRVGRLTVQALTGRYRLRLVDLHWATTTAPDTAAAAADGDRSEQGGSVERVTADVRDHDVWPGLLAGADTVIHLAADPSPQVPARVAVEDVAMATVHLAAAAVRMRLRRIVYASSVHAMGRYLSSGDHPVDPRWPPSPCCEYGAAKVFSEHLLALLVERSTVSVVSLRLGLTGTLPSNGFQASHWLGDDDCRQLMRCAVTADVSCGSYFGMSDGSRGVWDLSPTTADLGYLPRQLPPPTPAEPQPQPVGRCLMPG